MRALSFYLDRSKTWIGLRQSDLLLVSFQNCLIGQKVSLSMIRQWLRGCKLLAYKASRLDPPQCEVLVPPILIQ